MSLDPELTFKRDVATKPLSGCKRAKGFSCANPEVAALCVHPRHGDFDTPQLNSKSLL